MKINADYMRYFEPRITELANSLKDKPGGNRRDYPYRGKENLKSHRELFYGFKREGCKGRQSACPV